MSDDISYTYERQLGWRALRSEIETKIEADLDDTELVEALRRLTNQRAFASCCDLWGPELYRRDRVRFRPFIRNHLGSRDASMGAQRSDGWEERMRHWLLEVESAEDFDLFRAIYEQIAPRWGDERDAYIASDLVTRYRRAEHRRERERVLEMFDLSFDLDEETALELYTTDPEVSRDFIRQRMGRDPLLSKEGRHQLWQQLAEAADARGDDALYAEIYRQTVSLERWRGEVRDWLERIDDPETLVRTLERHHPDRQRFETLGALWVEMVRRRGEDVLPYIREHLIEAFRVGTDRQPFEEMLEMARQQTWWGLWGDVLASCANRRTYNDEIRQLLSEYDSKREIKEGLLALSQTSSERHRRTPGGNNYKQMLHDRTATAIYRRYPDLVRGPLKPHLSFGYHQTYSSLLEHALEIDDHVLIDEIARQAIVVPRSNSVIERLASYYDSELESPQPFVRRVTQVLGAIPSDAIWTYRGMLQSNPLAILVFEESKDLYIDAPRALRDLLESENVYVQGLAYRVLGQDDPRASQQAVEYLDHLQACLFRRMHARVRRWAFEALSRAVHASNVEYVIRRMRRALEMPHDSSYPEDALIAHLGTLLEHWPSYRRPSEHPVVYEWSPP